MFGSLTMLASGRFASSPSCVSQSGTSCAAVRFSGKLARILPAREMSASSMVIPLPPVYFLMIGSSEYVASAGASSISAQMILPGLVGMLQRRLLGLGGGLRPPSDRRRAPDGALLRASPPDCAGKAGARTEVHHRVASLWRWA